MSTQQQIQHEQYSLPYHYIPCFPPNDYSRALWLDWGWSYVANLRSVIASVPADRGLRLLDFGCGDGRLLAELARLRPLVRGVGIDYDVRALSLAMALSQGNAEYHASLDEVVGEFEFIAAVEVFEHIPPSECPAVLATLLTKLGPGGRLFLTVPSDSVSLRRKHYRHFSESDASLMADAAIKLTGAVFVVSRVRRVGAIPVVLRLLQRLLCNRVWQVSQSLVDRLLFAWTVKRFRDHSPAGRHIHLVIERPYQ